MTSPRADHYLALFEVPAGYLNIALYQAQRQDHGPGERAVVWIQGCLNHCTDCPSPLTQATEIKELVKVVQLAHRILSVPSQTGVTFTGGEPFWQAPALAALAQTVKAAGLNTIAYTCVPMDCLRSDYAPAGAADLLAQLDILVEGSYEASLAIRDRHALAHSSNQIVHVFNPQVETMLRLRQPELRPGLEQPSSSLS